MNEALLIESLLMARETLRRRILVELQKLKAEYKAGSLSNGTMSFYMDLINFRKIALLEVETLIGKHDLIVDELRKLTGISHKYPKYNLANSEQVEGNEKF